jgi:hypothetical protein
VKAILPSIAIGLLIPGEFVFRSIISAALSALVVAYGFAKAEVVVSEVMLKVAFITKSAAQADVFANRATAAQSVLPFTSAIAGVGIALSAAFVELSLGAASIIPAFAAVAAGVGAAAATRAEVETTSTRLAFRDSGIRRVAPPTTIPQLFGNVVPQMFASFVLTGAQVVTKSLTDFVNSSENKMEEGSRSSPLPAASPVVAIPETNTRLKKRTRIKNWIGRKMGFQPNPSMTRPVAGTVVTADSKSSSTNLLDLVDTVQA